MHRGPTWRLLFLSLGIIAIILHARPQAIAETPTHHHPHGPTLKAPHSSFEVASIRRTNPEQHIVNALLTYPGARVVGLGIPLKYLLMVAYRLPPAQIIGGPRWTRTTRFDIEAKPSAKVASHYLHLFDPKLPPPEPIRQMLRNLLITRFRLKLHYQEKTGTVFALVRTGRPLRLVPSTNMRVYPWAGGMGGGLPAGDGLRGENISMRGLASRLTRWLSEPVVDHTGLTGSYNFKVRTPPPEGNSRMDLNQDIFESLRELGLRLKKTTGKIRLLVIDSASQPTPN